MIRVPVDEKHWTVKQWFWMSQSRWFLLRFKIKNHVTFKNHKKQETNWCELDEGPKWRLERMNGSQIKFSRERENSAYILNDTSTHFFQLSIRSSNNRVPTDRRKGAKKMRKLNEQEMEKDSRTQCKPDRSGIHIGPVRCDCTTCVIWPVSVRGDEEGDTHFWRCAQRLSLTVTTSFSLCCFLSSRWTSCGELHGSVGVLLQLSFFRWASFNLVAGKFLLRENSSICQNIYCFQTISQGSTSVVSQPKAILGGEFYSVISKNDTFDEM